MHRSRLWTAWLAGFVIVLGTPGLTARGDSPAESLQSSGDPWQRSIDLVREGKFDDASASIDQLRGEGRLVEQLRTWLSEYREKQKARKEMDQVEFDRYVGFAKARIERGEHIAALDWAWKARDVAADQAEFLKSEWLQKLVNDSLTKAEESRTRQDWRGAWDIYARLAGLYDREPLYEKLARDAGSHLRLESAFKPDSKWLENLERIRWEDAEEALKHVEAYYVEPADFKPIAEHGLEQLLLLTDSKAAQQSLEGLQNEERRLDFRSRVQQRLEQIRAAPSLDREGCVQHFRRVVRDINKQTVQLPEPVIVNELMRGAFEPLDEFTTIIWPKDVEEFEKHTRGNFIGVGIQIQKNRFNEIEVQTPLDGTPAYRAGIQSGDIIAKVNGEPLMDVSLNKVVEIITGPKGTPVTLTIRREGKEIEFPLVRDEVKILSVRGMKRNPDDPERWNYWLDRENGVAYIRVTNFQRNTVEDVDNALRDLRAQGMKGLVLDIRGNPGGLLDSAWQMSSLFLKRGEAVVSTRGRIPDENNKFFAQTEGPYSDLPLTVLVDEGSASASEIVSGAIRDNGRGLVIGERTFGKFSVQNLIPLSHSRAKLKITTASYYLPSGVSLHRKTTSDQWGVDPNIPIRLVRWEQYNLYQMRRDADLLGPAALKANDSSPPAETAPVPPDESLEGEEPSPPEFGPKQADAELPPLKQEDENLRPKQDPQLDVALLVLRATLLRSESPTVAAAEKRTTQESARP
jgi:carboxyl-terminal processing protease